MTGGRASHRVRASRAGPVLEAHPKDDGASDAVRGAQPPRHSVDEPGEGRFDLSRRLRTPPDRALRTDRPPSTADLDGPRVVVVRERMQVATGVRPEDRHERGLLEPCHVSDGVDAAVVELRRGLDADSPEPLDRERVQEVELTIGRNDEQPVGLCDSARDLGEELGARDADGDRQADLVEHASRATSSRSRTAYPRAGEGH